jgi:hypothetical protein
MINMCVSGTRMLVKFLAISDLSLWEEVSMGGYVPHINRLFVVFMHCTRSCSRNTTVYQFHAMISIVRLARDFGSWAWRHWSL